MVKMNLASKEFKNNAKSLLNNKEVSLDTRIVGSVIREIAKDCFKYADPKIWGKIENSEELYELSDNQIVGSQGILVLGFGDAKGNGWYGAGPTRDMRRAYYTPMLLSVYPNFDLGKKFILSNLSENAKKIANSLDSLDIKDKENFYTRFMPKRLFGGEVKISEDENVDLKIFTENLHKFGNDYLCDLGILLTSNQVSGHNFLPREVAESSPLCGSLSLAMGNKENMMQGPVKSLYEHLHDKFNKFQNVIGKMDLKEGKPFPMTYVYNS